MTDDKNQRDDDATTGGGASTDRGGRDTGMPGPDPGSVPGVTTGAGRKPHGPTGSRDADPKKDRPEPDEPAPASPS